MEVINKEMVFETILRERRVLSPEMGLGMYSLDSPGACILQATEQVYKVLG